MLSVGETLRRARQAQELDLSTVAARTKISVRYLEAIESDDRKRLPSGFFYRSFVEQYAKSLSLDTREIDAEVDRVLSADEPLPLPGFESVVARNVRPMSSAHRFHTRRSYASAVSLVLVLVGCSGVYAWWHDAGSSFSVRGMMDQVRAFRKPAPVKPRTTVAKPRVDQPARTLIAHNDFTQSVPQQQPLVQRVAIPISLASSPKSAETGGGVIASAAISATSSDPRLSDYKVMLDLLAHEATWLSVSSDGKPVFSGTLHPNETKIVGGKQFAKIRVGNAAGLEVRLNGKPVGPLGARGQVLIVLFTPDNFQIFSPPKESD
jgi:cytoskeleton protein RodZ